MVGYRYATKESPSDLVAPLGHSTVRSPLKKAELMVQAPSTTFVGSGM